MLAAGTVSVALLVTACAGDDDDVTEDTASSEVAEPTDAPEDPVAAAEQRVADAENGVTQSQDALTEAHGGFCSSTTDYVQTLDRYGHLFTDSAATVGDVQTLGADLVEPRDEVVTAATAVQTAKDNLAAANQELVDAQAALAAAIATASSVPNSTTTPTTTTTTTLVPESSIERVQQAEEDLARVSEGISEDTPLVEAATAYNSAALSVQVAWLKLLNEAQCFTDEQQADAIDALTAYTAALQADLTTAGYDPGPIDGVYGPATVAAVEQLQTDSGLPVTGLVDEATARALAEKVAAAGQAQALQTMQLQQILSLAGYWDGPIDGVWTPELTEALMEFQTALGVEPTGVVDAATLAAFEVALGAIGTTTPVPTTPPNPTPTEPPATQAPTEPTEPPTSPTLPPEDGDEPVVLLGESELGPTLTAADGRTVYQFAPDEQGDPTCVDDCAVQWPPLLVDDASELLGGPGVDASLLGSVETAEGIQLTYNGWPLYVFAGDTAPGDVNGHGIGDVWFALDAAGNAIAI